MDAQIAYGVGFGCTLYDWKDNSKTLPMAPVSGQNLFGVGGTSEKVDVQNLS